MQELRIKQSCSCVCIHYNNINFSNVTQFGKFTIACICVYTVYLQNKRTARHLPRDGATVPDQCTSVTSHRLENV